MDLQAVLAAVDSGAGVLGLILMYRALIELIGLIKVLQRDRPVDSE